MNADGDPAVNFSAGDLFQYRCTRVRVGLQKRGETALRQQHGTGEAVEIHSGDTLYASGDILDFRFQNFSRCGVSQLMFRRLQLTRGMPARPVLAPVTAETSGLRFKRDFGETFAGLARQNLVTVF